MSGETQVNKPFLVQSLCGFFKELYLLLVVFDKDGGKSISLLEHIKIALELEDILGKKVDLITEGTLMPFAQETAEKDKILIYECCR